MNRPWAPEDTSAEVLARFWSKTRKSPDCWLWTGSPTSTGYGTLRIGGRAGYDRAAHRLSALIHFGAFDVNLCVLHHCDVPLCVNPTHLYLGTPADNATDRDGRLRGRHWGRPQVVDECPNGHPYDAANTYIHNGGRMCRECHRIREKARRQRIKAILNREGTP